MNWSAKSQFFNPNSSKADAIVFVPHFGKEARMTFMFDFCFTDSKMNNFRLVRKIDLSDVILLVKKTFFDNLQYRTSENF